MLEGLSDKTIRWLRKFFEEKNIPMTYENLRKFTTGDTEKNLFVYDAVESGLSQEEASKILDEVRAAASRVDTGLGTADEALSEPYTSKLEQDVFEARKAREAGWDKQSFIEKPDEAFLTSSEKEQQNALEGAATDADLEKWSKEYSPEELAAELRGELPTPSTGTPETDMLPVKEEPTTPSAADKLMEAEPFFPSGKVKPPKTSVADLDWDAIKQSGIVPKDVEQSGVGEADAIASMSKKSREQKHGKDSSTINFGPGGEGTLDNYDVKGLPLDEMVPGQGSKLVGSAMQRPTDISKLAVGPVPTTPSRYPEEVPDPLTIATTEYGTKSKNKLAPLMALMPKLVAAAKDPKATEEDKNLAESAMAFLSWANSLENPNLVETKVSASDKFKKGVVPEPQQRQLDTAIDELLGMVRSLNKPEMTPERRQDLEDQLFRTRAKAPEAKKMYTDALSSIEKRKMVDVIAKGLGQVTSGLVGQYGFSRPIPVAEHFKYQERDFKPELEEAGKAYRAAVSGIDKQVSEIMKAMNKGDSPEDIDKRIQAAATAVNAIAKRAGLEKSEFSQQSKMDNEWAGAFQYVKMTADILKEAYLLNEKNKAAMSREKEKSKRPPTQINIDMTDKTGAGIKEEVAIPEDRMAWWRAASMALRQDVPRILNNPDSAQRRNQLYDMIAGSGVTDKEWDVILGPANEWSSPEDLIDAIKNGAFNAWKRGAAKTTGTFDQDQTIRRKGGTPAPAPTPPAVVPKDPVKEKQQQLIESSIQKADEEVRAAKQTPTGAKKLQPFLYKGEMVQPVQRNGKLMVIGATVTEEVDPNSELGRKILGGG